MTDTTYDQVPYMSQAFAQTHIEHLCTIARLFGMTPPAPDRARVLELGCASGGNLLPMALEYPDGRFLGVDLSRRQIDLGGAEITALGVSNIELRHASIAEIDASDGIFDYIICHGVYSWVPSEIQQQIIAICAANLAPNGVAFVSYNTLPGWNMVRTLRDMMIFHTAGFPEPEIKIREARALLRFVLQGASDDAGLHVEIVRQELEALDRQRDDYLFHEFLEENNSPLYFHQFIAGARESRLQYLADANVPSMYLGNQRHQVVQTLEQIKDIVRTEQYMDFLSNRRFRQTLLCHADAPIVRHLDFASIERFYVASRVTPDDDPASMSLTEEREYAFSGAVNFTTRNRTLAALMATLALQRFVPIAPADLYRATAARIGTIDTEAVRATWIEGGLRLFLAGAIEIRSAPGRYATTLPTHPAASPLARRQALGGANLATNLRHQVVTLDPLGCAILASLDGAHDQAALIEKCLAGVERGSLAYLDDGQRITDVNVLRGRLAIDIERKLQELLVAALIER